MDFKPGDTVQLNSGGPLMTVMAVSGAEVQCQWFDAKKVLQKETFLAVVLSAYEPTVGVFTI